MGLYFMCLLLVARWTIVICAWAPDFCICESVLNHAGIENGSTIIGPILCDKYFDLDLERIVALYRTVVSSDLANT